MTLDDFKRHEEALLSYEQARLLDPEDPYIYECKALTLYTLKRYEEALEQCEHAIALDPEDPALYACKDLIGSMTA